MKQSNVLPGMFGSSIEFFVVENIVKTMMSGKVIDFTEIPAGIIELLREEINKDENVKLALYEMQPESDWKRLEQFVKCRFGGLDFRSDLQEGQFQDGEYWDCPVRSTCKHAGTVCKLPMVNGHRLTYEDIKLMQLSSTEMTNEVIAEELHMPMGSYHKAKASLHKNLSVQTKQGITKHCVALNLI
jgi:hypothetical protein